MDRNEYDGYFPPFSPLRELVRKDWNQSGVKDWYDYLELRASSLELVETWLPVFPGFYGTSFEPDEDYELSNISEDVDFDINPQSREILDSANWDFESYKRDTGLRCTGYVERELKSPEQPDLDFVTAINYQGISSPREYNFQTDEIQVAVLLAKENIANILAYLKSNTEAFGAYLKERYTSCEGFVSSHSNNASEWLKNYQEWILDSHKCGAMLDFIIRNEKDDPEHWMVDDCADINLEMKNYSEVVEKLKS